MEIRDINLKELKASKGMILTDGKDYARVTRLAEDVDVSKWHEIPEAEYNEILAKKAEEEAKARAEAEAEAERSEKDIS